jgi:A/G-specific adenine glycosylase
VQATHLRDTASTTESSNGPPLDQGRLLEWFAHHQRDLPWRRERDPWAVLVAEVMLQQTQVARALAPWRQFLARLPTPEACASAPVATVVELWHGLGYNRRAVQLHAAACAVVDRHGGALPDDLESLLALPGIGPYTARAVLAFAHEREVGVVDTNVGRVLARYRGETLGTRSVQAIADAAVPGGQGWAWNQAMLDLGATVCTKRSPACTVCPWQASCAWRGQGPDPAVGSAGVSGRQSRFEGSDRQGRGRLVAALRTGSVGHDALAQVCGWPDDPDRAARVARSLVRDGLAQVSSEGFTLPGAVLGPGVDTPFEVPRTS